MIYRIHIYSSAVGSEGYLYCATQKQADAIIRQKVKQGYKRSDIEIESSQTPKTKQAILRLLRIWAYHPDNG